MTGRIAEDKIQEIRERTDIVEVVSGYLPLKRSGANYQGLCPFHSEKTPSFNVNAPRQIFHCFGCGVGGNVFSFLMRMEGLSFPEAVRRLGERVGIEIEEERLSPAEQRRRDEAERLARINEVACDFYHRILIEEPEGASARAYLRKRGYDGETARRFRLGYAPDAWDVLAGHLARKGFDPELARDRLGLIRPSKSGRGDIDLFRRRLLFPIFDLRGKVVAFGGRVLDEALPKYINSPESPIYHKGRTLFGLYQGREAMRREKTGIIVEGYFDQLALARAGFDNAVATCGTALTEDHAKLLGRYCEKALLLFDQDGAGQKATFRAMDVLLAIGLPAAVVPLDPGEDPDSFLARHGAETFRERLAAARPVLEVYIDTVLAEHGAGAEGQARAVEQILAKLGLLPSEIERSLYLKELARRTGLDEALLQKMGERQRRASAPSPPPPPAPGPPSEAPPAGWSPARRTAPARPQQPAAGERAQDLLLQLLLSEADLRRRVAAEGVEAFFSDVDRGAVAGRILEVSGTAEDFDPGPLFDLLDEEQKAILSGILVKDGEIFAGEEERVFADCRQAVERERLRRRSRELTALIGEAAAAGDMERLAAYNKEKSDIKRQLGRRGNGDSRNSPDPSTTG